MWQNRESKKAKTCTSSDFGDLAVTVTSSIRFLLQHRLAAPAQDHPQHRILSSSCLQRRIIRWPLRSSAVWFAASRFPVARPPLLDQ